MTVTASRPTRSPLEDSRSTGTKASRVNSRLVSPSQITMSETLPRNKISVIRHPRRGFTGRKASTSRERKKPQASTGMNQNQFCRQSSRYSAKRTQKVEAMV